MAVFKDGAHQVRVALAAVLLMALCGSIAVAQQPALNEHCTVSVLNRTAQVRPDGSWELPNIPAGFGPVRARATCVENGVTRSGQSDFFTITPGRMNAIPPIVLGPTTPIPQSLAISAGATTLFQLADTTQLSVIATFAGGTTRNVTSASTRDDLSDHERRHRNGRRRRTGHGDAQRDSADSSG